MTVDAIVEAIGLGGYRFAIESTPDPPMAIIRLEENSFITGS